MTAIPKSCFFLKKRCIFACTSQLPENLVPVYFNSRTHTRCYSKRALARCHCFGVATARQSAPKSGLFNLGEKTLPTGAFETCNGDFSLVGLDSKSGPFYRSLSQNLHIPVKLTKVGQTGKRCFYTGHSCGA